MYPGSSVFATAELWNEIWSYIDEPSALIRFRRISRRWKNWLDLTLAARYDFDRFLKRYFPDPAVRRRFRLLMARHGVVISGSQALDFLGRFGFADKSDTDIYVGLDGLRELGNFFILHGFQYLGGSWAADVTSVSDDESSVYSADDVLRVFKFAGNQKIDIVLVADCPISAILHFHFTIVMNGLTWNSAFSAYPAATFRHKRGLIMRGSDAALEKYKARGFTLDSDLVGLPGSTFPGCLSTAPRTFGDGHTWVQPFDTGDLRVNNDARLNSHCFALSSLPYGSEPGTLVVSGFWMLAIALSHPLLRHAYSLHPSCRQFAIRVLDYVALHSCATTRSKTWRVSLGTYRLKLVTWDTLMPFVVHAWMKRRPLFLGRGRKTWTFHP